jgi:hypothetical protein
MYAVPECDYSQRYFPSFCIRFCAHECKNEYRFTELYHAVVRPELDEACPEPVEGAGKAAVADMTTCVTPMIKRESETKR